MYLENISEWVYDANEEMGLYLGLSVWQIEEYREKKNIELVTG